MKETKHYKGHRWSTEELKKLMQMWSDDVAVPEIAQTLNVGTHAVEKMIVRMRQEGIPLKRRHQGNHRGRAYKPWSQSEVEYLLRRRNEKATNEEIANDLGRSWCAVAAMVQKLRNENVPVAMRGMGVRRKWDVNALHATAMQFSEMSQIESVGDSVH